MKEIVDRVFLGDIHDAEAVIKGESVGVTGMINCTMHPVMISSRANIDVLMLYLNENSHIDRQMADKIISFIGAQIDNGGNILVHCHAGIQRSPSVVLVYLLSKGIPFLDGLHLIEEKKQGNIFPTPSMLRSIAKLRLDGKKVTDREISRFTRSYPFP